MPQALDQAVNTFPMAPFVPYTENEKAREKEVNIGPSLTLAAGTVMGQVSAAANDVQTITMGTATGGSFTLTLSTPTGSGNTAAINISGISNATIQAAVVGLVGAGNAVVSGAGPYVITFQGSLANTPIPIGVVNSSVTGGTAPAIAHTTTGASLGTWKAYASGNGDGTQTARGILKYAVITDAAGNVTFGSTAGGQWGQTYLTAPVYVCGTFRTLGMVGWDANARSNLAAHLESGTDADGVVRIA
jgi:hypothetical protein